MAAKQTTNVDPLGKTSCAGCNDTIEAGAYRVVVMMVEMRPSHYEETGGRGHSLSRSYCDSCVAEMPVFELPNLLKLRSDAAATPSARPADEDAHGSFRKDGEAILGRNRQRRVTSIQEIAQKGAAATAGHGDGDTLNVSDLEANVLSTQRPSRPGPEPAGEAAQRAKMVLFLSAPASRGMSNDLRTAARMWAEGASQNEVARKLGKDQSTVSRRIKTAQVMANAPR